jgi:hypothetical protein
MISLEVETPAKTEENISPEMIRSQLENVVGDEGFRSSKRSVAFLRHVIGVTLKGAADQIKERTIGMEVFGRSLSYEPNLDHIVRTAASEVRKRLAVYYAEESHRGELRILIPPGSYIPRFTLPASEGTEEDAAARASGHAHLAEAAPRRGGLSFRLLGRLLGSAVVVAIGIALYVQQRSSAEMAFWEPILDTRQPVLLALGDVPNGPPHSQANPGEPAPTPVIAQPSAQGTVPLADAVTMARLYSALQAHGNRIVVRPGNSISFSDLREGPVVLIGAFNNPWSLRLIGKLRFSLALDDVGQLIYIRDSRNPDARNWSWGTHQPVSNIGGAGAPVLHDYALISRVRSPQTGHFLVVVGGLFVYGTQAAGEFLSDPEALKALSKVASMDGKKSLQIVLETTVTDATPGPARVVAISEE